MPHTPLAEKFSYTKGVLGPIEMCLKFRLSRSSSFRDMRGSQNYGMVSAKIERFRGAVQHLSQMDNADQYFYCYQLISCPEDHNALKTLSGRVVGRGEGCTCRISGPWPIPFRTTSTLQHFTPVTVEEVDKLIGSAPCKTCQLQIRCPYGRRRNCVR